MSSVIDLDQAPVAPRGSLGGVPVIDLSGPHDRVLESIAQACADWGFFQVVGHGLGVEDSHGALAAARSYFALPRETKRQQLRSRENPWGFNDRELTKEKRDRKEVFDIGPDVAGPDVTDDDPFAGHTPWPDEFPAFKQEMGAWFGTMTGLSERLMAIIAESLGDADEITRAFTPTHTSYLRLNYYPAGDPLAGELGAEADLGIHHHSDAGALTVLLQDGVRGLQVYRDGQWHDVEPVPGAFTINIGDMVQVWSNDLYRAPQHRVLAMERNERLSIPYFYNPAYSATVRPLASPPRYRDLNWGEFRRRRADGDYASYGTEVQIAEWRIAAA